MVNEFSHVRILYYGKKSDYYAIQQISTLAKSIQTRGISSIRQIIFEFVSSPQFPYTHHNISLCNTGNQSFVVQFYHYYNSLNQLNVLRQDIQNQDYHTLITFLYSQPVLQDKLIPYIYPPFTNDLKEQT
jgi:hypothetical protein